MREAGSFHMRIGAVDSFFSGFQVFSDTSESLDHWPLPFSFRWDLWSAVDVDASVWPFSAVRKIALGACAAQPGPCIEVTHFPATMS